MNKIRIIINAQFDLEVPEGWDEADIRKEVQRSLGTNQMFRPTTSHRFKNIKNDKTDIKIKNITNSILYITAPEAYDE